MGVLQDIERRRALQKVRGAARPRRRPATGPAFRALSASQQQALQDYIAKAGPYWRSALLSACLRGASKHPRFELVLCPLVRAHGPMWLRTLRVPRGGASG